MADYVPTTPRSIQEVRAELDKIAAAIRTVLHRDGTAPNQMTADFDMNGNDILNAMVEGTSLSTVVSNAQAATDAANNAAANADKAVINLPSGQWAAGVTFRAVNEFMYFNGVGYTPRPTTSLPYTTQGSDPTQAPDVSSVMPFSDISSTNIANFSKIVFDNVAGMVAYTSPALGDTYTTGGTSWKVTNNTSALPIAGGLFAEPISTIFPSDFDAAGDGATNDTAVFTQIEQYGDMQTVNLEGKTFLVDAIPVTDKYINGFFRVGSRSTPQFGLRYEGKTELAGMSPERVNEHTVRIFPGYCSDGATVPTDTIVLNTSVDIDFNTNGLNGLDTGSPSVDSTYSFYVLKNSSTGEVGAVASLAISTASVTRPAGFDLIRKLPVGLPWLAAHSVNPEGIPAFHIEGWPLCTVKFTNVDENQTVWQVLSEGTQDTLSTVDCARIVPDNARMVLFHCETKSYALSGLSRLRAAGTGGVGKPVGYARQDFDYEDAGVYTNNKVLSSRQRIVYVDDGTSNTYWRATSSASLPYTIDTAMYPTPDLDPNLEQVNEDGDRSFGEFWTRVTSARNISYMTSRGTNLTLRVVGYSMTERS